MHSSFALAIAELGGATPEDFSVDIVSTIYYRQGEAFSNLHMRDLLDGAGIGPLAGKVVLVGAKAAALMDVKVTPIGALPGVELNANLVASILDGKWIRVLPSFKVAILIILAAILVSLCSLVLPPLFAIAVTVAMVFLWLLLAVIAMKWVALSLPVMGPLLASAGSSTIILLARARAAALAAAEQAERDVVPATQYLEEALALVEEKDFEEALIMAQHADQSPKKLQGEEVFHLATLRCEILARLGESRLLEISLQKVNNAPNEQLYKLAIVLDEEGYLSHGRSLLEEVYRRDISYEDVEQRLSSLRERSRRGELVVNVRGVRELLGSRFSRVKPLAEGGMGVIFTAEDSRLGKRVAIKVLHPYLMKDEKAIRRFLAEVKAVRALKHPNIVRIFELEKGKAPYYTMEYCDGMTLTKLIEKQKLDKTRSLAVLWGIAKGLEHAHSRKVVHRDLKPDNIIVTKTGTVKIIDFGVAKTELTKGMTEQGEIIGTRKYMAPEQMRGESVDGRADFYALGVIADEMGVGDEPLIKQLMAEDIAQRPTDVAAKLAVLAGLDD